MQNVSGPRVTVLYSTGGGGHVSGLHAIRSALASDYDVQALAPIEELLRDIDVVWRWTRGRTSGEKLYNRLISSGPAGLISAFGRWGGYLFASRHDILVGLLSDHLRATRPSLVISTIPYINAAMLEAARACDVAFAIVPCDLDVRHYLLGVRAPTYPRFRMTTAFDTPWLRAYLHPAELAPTQITAIGFPQRPAFAEPVTADAQAALRESWNVPPHKRLVAILTGGAGGKTAMAYARGLRLSERPLHVIACAGRNAALREAVQALAPTEHVTFSAVGFMPDIERLMGAADVLITKPGPNSVLEAAALGVPVLLDCTRGVVEWEKASVRFALENRVAEAVTNLQQLPALLAKQLDKPRTFSSPLRFPKFATELRRLVDDLVSASPAAVQLPPRAAESEGALHSS